MVLFLTENVFSSSKKIYHFKERPNDNILESWISRSIDRCSGSGYKGFCIENYSEICLICLINDITFFEDEKMTSAKNIIIVMRLRYVRFLTKKRFE